MFSRIRDFLYRHRRKFLVGGIVLGGATLLSRYAERKLLEWHNEQTQTLLEKQKKRQHYENTLRTSNATVMSLAGSIREVVVKELDSDTLLQAVKDQPQCKVTIWEQLKVVGFSRAVSCVYVGSLVSGAIRVQLMLLGGYTFCDLAHAGHAGTPISQSLQQKYLTAVHYLVEEGMPKLVQHITKVVAQVVSGIPLNRRMTLSQLEGLFHEIRLSLLGEATGCRRATHRIETWTKYVLEVPVLPEGKSDEDKVLYNMLVETCDVLDSEDFNTVMDTLIHQGFNVILDRLADFYPSPKQVEIKPTHTSTWVSNVSQHAPQSTHSHDLIPPLTHPPQQNITAPQISQQGISLPQQINGTASQHKDEITESIFTEEQNKVTEDTFPQQNTVTEKQTSDKITPNSSPQNEITTETQDSPQQRAPQEMKSTNTTEHSQHDKNSLSFGSVRESGHDSSTQINGQAPTQASQDLETQPLMQSSSYNNHESDPIKQQPRLSSNTLSDKTNISTQINAELRDTKTPTDMIYSQDTSSNNIPITGSQQTSLNNILTSSVIGKHTSQTNITTSVVGCQNASPSNIPTSSMTDSQNTPNSNIPSSQMNNSQHTSQTNIAVGCQNASNDIPSIPGHSNRLITSSVPVAKLIPVLTGLIHAALSPMPGQLLQKLLTDGRLDSLGANVYEVYTVPLGKQ